MYYNSSSGPPGLLQNYCSIHATGCFWFAMHSVLTTTTARRQTTVPAEAGRRPVLALAFTYYR